MIDKKHRDDIKEFSLKYSDFVHSVHLFGSLLNKEVKDVNDIDLAIVVKNKPLNEFKKLINSHEFVLNVRCASANGSYVGGGGGKGSLDYHFVLLDKDHINQKFVELNPDMQRII